MSRRYAMHKTGNRDANQKEIEDALTERGISWADITNCKGVGDLLVGYEHRTYQFEVKNPNDSRNRGKKARLTPAQQEFRDSWQGHYAVAKCVDDVLDVLQFADRKEKA